VKLDRIKSIYTELEKYSIELNSDPRSLGPVYLNDLIATTRNFLNSVSRIQLEVHQEKQYLSRALRAAEAAFQVSFDDLLANDERVRRLPSIEDRKATASVFLRDQRNTIDNLKAELQDVEFVEKAIRHTHRELTSTMSEIKLQRSLIRDEIDTGAMYGDERIQGPDGRGGPVPEIKDLDTEELARILDGASGEEEDPSVKEAPVVVPVVTTAIVAPFEVTQVTSVPLASEDQAITAFLAGGTKQIPPSIDDFADVFENL
jgi:hypothetical protein